MFALGVVVVACERMTPRPKLAWLVECTTLCWELRWLRLYAIFAVSLPALQPETDTAAVVR